jgi:quercetin dioxygenase-like cupin family protein
MVSCLRFVTLTLLAAAACAQDSQPAPAARPAEAAVVVFDNDEARLTEITLAPGGKLPPRRWADRVVIDTERLNSPKEPVRGIAVWHDAGEQAFENSGRAPQTLLVLELKPLLAAVMPAPVPQGPDALSACKSCTSVLLENERVRAYRVRLEPGEKLNTHVHPANLVYSVTDVNVKFTLADGTMTQRSLPAGKAAWNPPVKHDVENSGKQAAVFIHVERKAPR